MGQARSRWAVSVRRSPHLVAYWRNRTLIACNYATGSTAEVPPGICDLLDVCHDWTRLEDLEASGVISPSSFSATIDRLVALTLLERSDRPADPRVRALSSLQAWNPAAGFFHATTRDLAYASPRRAAKYAAAPKSAPPAAVKRYKDADTVTLSKPQRDSEFPQVLKARRTWRRYSSRPVVLDELGTLLALTSGIHQWVRGDGFDIPLKTSPSGGARHSVECYVVARDVRGLKAGVYYYAPDRHVLQRLGGSVPIERMRAYVPGSEYFASASAMVFFTAVFERILWRYAYPRAYRAALIEAGHVCQTFCLTATWLGLAPFCVMALADSLIEQDLGIDGITESVIYGAGVGRPPRGVDWAPLARGSLKARPNRRITS
jgi:SagB-type dehydrogenase family enzyme